MPERSDLPAIGPVLWYRDPVAAIEWLKAAFGFEIDMVVDDGSGGVAHSELRLRDGYIMVLGPPVGQAASPSDLDGRYRQSIHVQVPTGLDALCVRARRVGATIEREPADQPYGDRVFTCRDPEGHAWSFGQAQQFLTLDEMAMATGHRITGGVK